MKYGQPILTQADEDAYRSRVAKARAEVEKMLADEKKDRRLAIAKELKRERLGFHENTESIERVARGKSTLSKQFWREDHAAPSECVTVYLKEPTK